jgi:hypothetical protein
MGQRRARYGAIGGQWVRATLGLAAHSGTKRTLARASFRFRVLSYSHSVTGKLNLAFGMSYCFFEPCDDPPAKRAML